MSHWNEVAIMAFKVIYDGNGATGGTFPLDGQAYDTGDVVTIIYPRDSQGTDTLTKSPDRWARWNTAADGTGAEYGWPGDDTFKMGTSDVMLYAMWYTTDGLTDPFGKGPGVTHVYAFWYESCLKSQGVEPARTNQLLLRTFTPAAVIADDDYDLMQGWFPRIFLTSSSTPPLRVDVANLGGGAKGNYPVVTLKPGSGDDTFVRDLIVAEVTEFFMLVQKKGWFSPDGSVEQSCGEGLSRFLAQQFLMLKTNGPYWIPGAQLSWKWLNSSLPPGTSGSTQLEDWTTLTDDIDATTTSINVADAQPLPFAPTYVIEIDSEQMVVTSVDTTAKSFTVTRGYNGTAATAHAAKTGGAQTKVSLNYGARADYVNLTLKYDVGIDAATGCAMLFLYYLNYQLGYDTTAIIGAAPGIDKASTLLREVYRGLSNDQSDPFPAFKNLLDSAFPPDAQATIPGPNPDNPFPLGTSSTGGGGSGPPLGGCPGIKERYDNHSRLRQQLIRQLNGTTDPGVKAYLQHRIDTEDQILYELEGDWIDQGCHGTL
jgi:hypothetical protein